MGGYNVEIHDKKKDISFKGRLVGFIDKYEKRAVLNVPKAPNKVFTSQSISFNDPSLSKFSKFFVVATSDHPEHKGEKILFISPMITGMSWKNFSKDVEFRCKGYEEYVVKEISA